MTFRAFDLLATVITVLIAALGNDDYSAREAASKALSELDVVAVPQLTSAVGDPDPEIGRRAQLLLEGYRERYKTDTLACIRLALRSRGYGDWPWIDSLPKYEDQALSSCFCDTGLRDQRIAVFLDKAREQDPDGLGKNGFPVYRLATRLMFEDFVDKNVYDRDQLVFLVLDMFAGDRRQYLAHKHVPCYQWIGRPLTDD